MLLTRVLLVLLVQLSAMQVSAVFTGKLQFASVTARTQYDGGTNPNMALDGDPGTIYHSGVDDQPEWLLLTLDSPAAVSSLTIINRYNAIL